MSRFSESVAHALHTNAAHDVCLPRRQSRDVNERGYTAESVVARYATTVRPMADQFINPTKEFADIVLDGCRNIEESAARVLTHIQQNRK